ncbi:GTP-binding protein [Demequina aurantiaca]|uniref:GTP-binding protein n=1 Tax=Demequina aurantiaca TaxID=676200 RepID=UPI0013649AC7|nr:ATP/GTP-binding protein [Demequina aurantiaca]
MESQTFKVVVAGPFASGKTTFIASAADGDIIGSENAISDATKALKQTTTTAMDHATIELAGSGDFVGLFGTPGQERFSFMWPVLAQGMHGYLILIDASRLQARAQSRSIVRAFATFAPQVPMLIAANRWDPNTLPRAELAEFIGVDPSLIVSCDPRDKDQCHETVQNLLRSVQVGESA